MDKEFFGTELIRRLHPELTAREDIYDGKDCIVFSNSKCTGTAATPEWPSEIDLWVEHEHERGVDGEIYDPLRLYADRCGLSEKFTGLVYDSEDTLSKTLALHLSCGYAVDVLFGECIELSESHCDVFVRTPHDVELKLRAGPQKLCVMVRTLYDKRLCAISGSAYEPFNYLYYCTQFASDGFRRYDFSVYPLHNFTLPNAQKISAADYVHYFAAMYDSCIMLAHNERSRL